MKKQIALVLLLVLIIGLLAGCGHEHTWQDATCTAPKTCAGCGETEGDALGHNWLDATCTAPKTCAGCGATEGEPLEHTLTVANYQQAATCTVCGTAVGEPLTPDFVTYGLTRFVEAGKEYSYVTVTSKNSSAKTLGTAVFSYVTAEPYDYNGLDYVRYTFTVTLTFSDENANKYGISIDGCHEDYYDVLLHDSTISDAGDYQTYKISMNGTEQDALRRRSDTWTPWKNNSRQFIRDCEYIVPAGYDGTVEGVRDAGIDWPDGLYIYDLDNTNTLFFRVTDWVQ